MPTVLLGTAVGAAVVYGIDEGDPMAVQKKVCPRQCACAVLCSSVVCCVVMCWAVVGMLCQQLHAV